MSQICITNFSSKIKSSKIKNIFKKFDLGQLQNVDVVGFNKIKANIEWNNNLSAKEIKSKLGLSNNPVYIYDKKSLWNIYLDNTKVNTNLSNNRTINDYQISDTKYNNSWLKDAYM